jgi:hypothetical protein
MLQVTYRSYSPEATGPAMGVGELECIGMRSFTIGSGKYDTKFFLVSKQAINETIIFPLNRPHIM